MEIFNSPQDSSVIEVEARKSLAFGMWFTDSRGWAVDLTGASVTMTVTKFDRYHQHVVLFSTAAHMADAQVGYCTINVQASELDVKPSTYQFAITLRINGYSVVVMKGDFTVRQNAEFSSAGQSFAAANPSQNLEVQLRNQTNVHLELSTVLPPNLVTPTDASDAAVANYVANPTSLTSQQLDIRFVTHTELTTALQPKADKTYVDTQDNARVARSLYASKGQILAASAASTPTALAPGENGQVLIASSGQTTGLRWSTLVPAGVIMPFAGNQLPAEYLLCNGAAVSRSTYLALFNAIGELYGAGNGTTTFNLPNLQGRAPIGYDGTQTEFNALGKTGGAKTHTLSVNEMPSHTHDWVRDSGTSTTETSFNIPRHHKTTANGGEKTFATGTTGEVVSYYNLGSTGGGAAHNNLQPYQVINYIIKT
ncbi:minor tail protein [Microbacterium phage Araxxi]|uniref:Minor tail protein n=1 Tax=Microbacterium phage Araxxi TaxID=2590948 RepID=A0A516KT37_9CAUD|nr:tail protein [Microbacterium phage Araxxi]QDP44852.1 minor tail protein [Microbacterium phage Araxxi]